jgi:WD40 repeat protein
MYNRRFILLILILLTIFVCLCNGDGEELSGYGSDIRWQKYIQTLQAPYREITLPHAHSDSHFTLSVDRQRGLYGDFINPMFYFIDINSGHILKTLEIQLESLSIQCASFSSDGKRAVSAGGNYSDLSIWDHLKKKSEMDWFLCLWDLSNGRKIGLAKGKGDFIRNVAYSPIDNKAITCGDHGDIVLWDLEKMQVLKSFDCHSSGIRRNCLVWSQDGKTFLSGGWDGFIRLWSVEKGKELAKLSPGYGRVMSLALSPDGKYALSSYLNGPNQPVILWDLENQREINRFGIPGNPWDADQRLHVASVAFSPDGKTALFGLVFGTVIWWDLNEWRQIAMNRLHEKDLQFVAYSAYGKSSISMGWDTSEVIENVKVKFWKLPDQDR